MHFKVPKILSLTRKKSDRKYLRVRLQKNGQKFHKAVHRAVLEAFVGPCPDGMECRHLNGKADDNRLENLQWGTQKENLLDKLMHGTQPRGSQVLNSKLHEANIPPIRELLRRGVEQKTIGEIFGVSPHLIHLISKGKSWDHVPRS